MAHIKLVPSKQFKISFNPKELDNAVIPDESKKVAQDYIKSKKTIDDNEYDILMMFEDKVTFGFDYIHGKTKSLIVELNPVSVFYSNAVMSYGNLQHYRNVLLSQAQNVRKIGQPNERMNLTHSGMYFQLAINCVINLQAALESFANGIIPEDYHYLDLNGNPVHKTITYKLTYVLPKVKEFTFELTKNKKHRKIISDLITLRNDIIHLKPVLKTNTGYKDIYRRLLDFDYFKALTATRTFINFYEPDLIHECECGQDFYFYSSSNNEES